jgi:type IV secretory pathway VirB2 component (pilin)
MRDRLRSSAAALAAFAWPLRALATESGGDLPWNKPLEVLKANITGPTATLLILIALAFAFVLWSFSDNNHGLMRAFKALIALAVVASAATLLSGLGIDAATL